MMRKVGAYDTSEMAIGAAELAVPLPVFRRKNTGNGEWEKVTDFDLLNRRAAWYDNGPGEIKLYASQDRRPQQLMARVINIRGVWRAYVVDFASHYQTD